MLAKSKAGETKFATTLMPSVATANVSAASSARNQLSKRAEISSGMQQRLVIDGESRRRRQAGDQREQDRFTGRPQILPIQTARLSGA